MRIISVEIVGIRSFNSTGVIALSPTMNIVVGRNNTGKSALLDVIKSLEAGTISADDWNSEQGPSYASTVVWVSPSQPDARYNLVLRGPVPDMRPQNDYSTQEIPHQPNANNYWLVPFLSKRKAAEFSEVINANTNSPFDGTHQFLSKLVDELQNPLHEKHSRFRELCELLLGFQVGAFQTGRGKRVAMLFNRREVALQKMGDGISEMLAMITALCIAKDKIFVIDEPETSLHPTALKKICQAIRDAASGNQFIIATHSNIVLRELGSGESTKIWQVSKDEINPGNKYSSIVEVNKTATAHHELLKTLGYDFSDYYAHAAWLFLEEATAERIIRDVLVPDFAPNLKWKLRTYSAAGADGLEPAVDDFTRAMTFVHLQPIYKDKLWVRADGDEKGKIVIQALQTKFSTFLAGRISSFSRDQFERYYPKQFEERANALIASPPRHKSELQNLIY